jgi:pSer/pThr/pTyr-binding forkhead associated (FHA) protein
VHAFLEMEGDPDHPPIALHGDEIRIGRSADNEIRFEDNSVSRHHATLHRGANGHYAIHDLHSLNGVYVNDRQVQSATLKDGDRVEMGDLVVRYRLHAIRGAPDLERTVVTPSQAGGRR